MRPTLSLIARCAVVTTLTACGASAPSSSGAAGDPVLDAPVSRGLDPALLEASCDVAGAALAVGSRQGSSVAVVSEGERRLALLADRDRKTVYTFDLAEQRIVDAARLSGAPEQVLALEDGRVFVTIVDGAHVEVLTRAEGHLTTRCARSVPGGPFGLAASEDGATLVVSSNAGAATVFDAKTMDRHRVVALPRSPRGVLVKDGAAFVTHLAGTRVSSIALASGEVHDISTSQRAVAPAGELEDFALERRASQSYAVVSVSLDGDAAAGEAQGPLRGGLVATTPRSAPRAEQPRGRIVLPMVSIDPGTRLTQAFQNYYGPPPIAGINKITPSGVVVDPSSRELLSTKISALDHAPPGGACVLPRAAVSIEGTSRVFVACLGSDEVIELEGARANPMAAVRRRLDVPRGPTGLAVDASAAQLVVYSQFESAVTLVDLASFDETVIPLDLVAELDPALAVGRELFHRVDDARITREGIACASCHPDALDDGVVWRTPEGPRQTISLAGRVRGSAPFGWTRGRATLHDYIDDTCRRLGGSGMQYEEVAAIGAWLESLPSPPLGEVLGDVEDGARVFAARGCATCHVGGDGVDGASHRFGIDPRADMETPRDTPSLRRVAQSAPFFHDGRYESLRALLSDPASRMGETRELSATEREALLAYLSAL